MGGPQLITKIKRIVCSSCTFSEMLCFSMQISKSYSTYSKHYIVKLVLDLLIFPEQKSVRRIKPGKMLLFHFVDILDLNFFFFTEGILRICFDSSTNEKILSITIKK